MKIMKSRILAGALTGLFLVGIAHGQTYTNVFSSATLNTPITVGNPVGTGFGGSISGALGLISSVTVSLDITGGNNGDLYVYLDDPAQNIAILLNRAGLSSGNPFGYSDAGFNITLSDDSPNNIHYYGNDNPTFTGGQLNGTWAPDAQNLDPAHSTGAQFDSTAPNPAFDLSSFIGDGANGQWTLYVADVVSGGDQPTLVSWGLTVVTVPEPQTWLLLAGGVGMLVALNRHRKL